MTGELSREQENFASRLANDYASAGITFLEGTENVLIGGYAEGEDRPGIEYIVDPDGDYAFAYHLSGPHTGRFYVRQWRQTGLSDVFATRADAEAEVERLNAELVV